MNNSINISKYSIIVIFLFILYGTNGHSFENKVVHRMINEKSAEQSLLDQVLKDCGFPQGLYEPLLGGDGEEKHILEWIKQGGKDEDDGTRALFHFLDPTKDWGFAGLKGVFAPSVIWAQASESNDASWNHAREHFYQALISGAEEEYASTFKILGQLMHLISDKAVPAHVRDDAHLVAAFLPITHFEVWTKDEVDILNYNGVSIDPAIFNNFTAEVLPYGPISALWDTDQYTGSNPEVTLQPLIGLAEFTNANFFSEDTVFSSEYYPKRDDAGIKAVVKMIEDKFKLWDFVAREYWMKEATGNMPDYLLANKSFHTFFVDSRGVTIRQWHDIPGATPMDKYVFKDYADLLVPRAVGYSTALLDYFFRGKIDIQDPIVTFDSESSITELTFSMKNTTPALVEYLTVEQFVEGDVELVYSYIPTALFTGSDRIYHHITDSIYSVYNQTDPINTEYIPITVSLPLAIPAGVRDVSFALVFKGQLGDEHGAVATGFNRFDNSRIVYAHQPDFSLDVKPNARNIYTISPDGAYLNQVTNAVDPTDTWYWSPTWSKDGTRMAFVKERCTDPEDFDPQDPFCPREYYSRDIVVVDMLAEQQFPDNILLEINFDGKDVDLPAFSPDGTKLVVTTREIHYFNSLVVYDLEDHTQSILNEEDNLRFTSLGWGIVGQNSYPAWSPTGEQIVYNLHKEYDGTGAVRAGDLILVNSDGTGRIRLTDDDFINMQPTWSPDGEWIVFSSDRDDAGRFDLWKMFKDGNFLSKFYDCSPGDCYSPTFSPDGQQLAIIDGSNRIMILSMDSDHNPASLQVVAEPGLRTGPITWSSFLLPPSIEVQVEPEIIGVGEFATLSWNSKRTTDVYISGIDGELHVTGSIAVYPTETTSYTITAAGPTGTKEKTVTIVVVQ